jgi:hypothetical protein
MQQKYYWAIGAVIVLLIIFIFFISFPSKNTGTAKPQMALAPYVEFEGTVVSLSLDKKVYFEGNEIESAPGDSAVVKIDKIVETGSSNFNWSSLGIEEGKEVSLNFTYTARPAKIITHVGETQQSGDSVSHTVFPTKITFEKGYFVFEEDGNSETEKILSGLKVGSKFKTKLWQTPEVKVEKYEILS